MGGVVECEGLGFLAFCFGEGRGRSYGGGIDGDGA